MMALKIFLLGPPRIELNGSPVDIKRRKALAMLIYLAVTGQPHSRDALATLFYPNHSQSRARAYLRRDLAVLNTGLNNDWLDADRETIELKSGLWTDVTHFRKLVAECRQHDHPPEQVCSACIPPLTEAAQLYTDDFLAGFTLRDCPEFDDWQFFEAESLRQVLASVLERLVGALSDQERYEAAIPHARRWVALDPLHEPAQRQLIQLYAQTEQQAAAIRQYEEYANLLDEELGLPPQEETATLYEAIKAKRMLEPYLKTEEQGQKAGKPERRAATQKSGIPQHNLPSQTTPFVGRKRELDEINRLLLDEPDCRLLTLIGAGGIGKTRLALEAAAQLLDAFAHGVYFAPLTALTSADQIVATLAEQLNFHFRKGDNPQQQLLDYLSRKQMLLVMDNFEHLLEGSRLIVELLETAPEVKLLVTSRERLNLSGETVYLVGGLAYPEHRQEKAALEYSAVKLFWQRARRVRPELNPQADDLNQIVRICRLVQGMPLALTLAAGWVEALSLTEIADQIVHSLDFLETEMRDVPRRQRSMPAVFDTSWKRLSDKEQQTFMKLSVFRGSFIRPAAQAVAEASLPTLRALVNKSFLSLNRQERYEIHELLRQFGQEKLAASGQTNHARNAHALYYLDALRRREAALKGGRQIEALAEIEADLENVRAAWQWALAQKNLEAINHALESLFLFFDMRSRHQEGAELFRLAGEQVAQFEGEGSLWGRLMARAGWLQAHYATQPGNIERIIEKSLAIAQQQAAPAEAAFCHLALGAYHALVVGEFATGQACFEQSLAQYRPLDDRYYMSRVLVRLGYCRGFTTGLEAYYQTVREGLTLAREAGNQVDVALALTNLSSAAFGLGNYAAAEEYCRESLARAAEIGTQLSAAHAAVQLALIHFLDGNMDRVEGRAAEGLAIATDINFSITRALALAVLGLAANVAENYALGQERSRESLAVPSNTFVLIVGHWALAMAQCGLGDYQAARPHAQAALKQAVDFSSAAMSLWPLPIVVVILAHTDRPKQAVELLALAFSHPLRAGGWLEQWPLLTRLRARLETELGGPTYQAAWERGQSLDVMVTVTALLEELEAEEDSN